MFCMPLTDTKSGKYDLRLHRTPTAATQRTEGAGQRTEAA